MEVGPEPIDPETRNVLRIEFQTYLALLDARMARDRQQSSYDMYILFFQTLTNQT